MTLEQLAEQYADEHVWDNYGTGQIAARGFMAGARAALESAIAKINGRIENERSLGPDMLDAVWLLELARNDLVKLAEKGADA